MTQKTKSILLLFLCSILWSIAGIIIKFIKCNPFVIAGIRSLFATLPIITYAVFSKTKLKFTKKAITSSFFFCGTFLCFVVSNKLTTAANAIVLQYTTPIFIVIISVLFLKKKITNIDKATVIITMLGIVLFFIDKLDAGRTLGNIIAIMAGITLAIMFLICGEISLPERLAGVLAGHTLTALVGIPFVFFTENTLDLTSLSLIILLGIVQLGIPYLLYSFAAEHCPALEVSLIGTLEPILNPIWVAIWFGEKPGILAFIGGIIVLSAIVARCIILNKKGLLQ